MSKKKPYSEVENGKALRALKFEHAKMQKKFIDAPEWYQSVVDNYYGIVEAALDFDNVLHVKATAEGKSVVRSEILTYHGKKYVQVLERQLKAMNELAKILKIRFDAGIPAEPCKEGCQADCTECKGKDKGKK